MIGVTEELVTLATRILDCPDHAATGAPRKIPAKATESMNPPAAAAIKDMLSFTQLSQLIQQNV